MTDNDKKDEVGIPRLVEEGSEPPQRLGEWAELLAARCGMSTDCVSCLAVHLREFERAVIAEVERRHGIEDVHLTHVFYLGPEEAFPYFEKCGKKQ